jgi:tRNA threonylcarbamoyladenosine biosynthesis protein TsaB
MDDENIKDCFEQKMDFGQSEVLISQIKIILEKNNLLFRDIGAVFVCTGPGSFTGVRASISAARVFGVALPDLKIGGISAFEAYKKSFCKNDIAETNAIIIETRRDDFYVQLFDKNMQSTCDPMVMTYSELLGALKMKGCMVSLAGDGVERFLNQPSGLCLHAIKMFDSAPIEYIAKAGIEALKNKRLNFPKPLYLRAPDVSSPSTNNHINNAL